MPAQFSIAPSSNFEQCPSMEEDGFSIEKKRTFVIELLSPVIMHWTTMLHNLDLSRHTVISDNGPKRWDSSVVSQETRRCGANLTLVHRKRRRFLRGDRRSRYIIARLVVSSGARGDIQPLAAVKPSSHDPRFPPPGPLPPNILFPRRASWTYVTTPVTPRRHTRRAHAVPYSFLAVTRWYLVFFDSAAAFACD